MISWKKRKYSNNKENLVMKSVSLKIDLHLVLIKAFNFAKYKKWIQLKKNLLQIIYFREIKRMNNILTISYKNYRLQKKRSKNA